MENNKPQYKSPMQLMQEVLTELASLHKKVDEMSAKQGNPPAPQVETDPEIEAKRLSILNKIKNAQLEELNKIDDSLDKKTLEDLQTPVEGEVVK